MSEPAKVNYALAIDSAVVYVALALDKAAGAALSVEDLAKGYTHPIPADLNRVKLHEELEDERAATEWVIRRAIIHLGKGVELVPVGDQTLVSMANGHKFEDLRFRGKHLYRPGPDIHAVLRDPFNPMSGTFSANIRADLGDLTELRESLKAHGWVSEFPALIDERGVVLVGGRRMAVAKELGIEPVTKVLHIGAGDAADAQRLRLAIVSNIGSKKLSPTDRKRIAAYLYESADWSQERVAEALSVDQKTVSNDLYDLGIVPKSKKGKKRTKTTKQPGEIQRQASVNVKPEIWESFKAKAEEEGQSSAAKLGEFIAREVEAAPEIEPHVCTCPTCGNKH